MTFLLRIRRARRKWPRCLTICPKQLILRSSEAEESYFSSFPPPLVRKILPFVWPFQEFLVQSVFSLIWCLVFLSSTCIAIFGVPSLPDSQATFPKHIQRHWSSIAKPQQEQIGLTVEHKHFLSLYCRIRLEPILTSPQQFPYLSQVSPTVSLWCDLKSSNPHLGTLSGLVSTQTLYLYLTSHLESGSPCFSFPYLSLPPSRACISSLSSSACLRHFYFAMSDFPPFPLIS